jgi:RHS repeat-associated protein
VALASGASIQTQYGYDPYGVAQTTGVASTNPYQFTGRENDQTAAGLMYYRARYYNPAWGRFVSEDPIGIAGGTNLYGYANQNPVNFGDPSGQFAFVVPFIYACLADPICGGPLIFGSAILARDIAAEIPNIWIWCSEAKDNQGQGEPDQAQPLPKPAGIPDNWIEKPSDKGGGTEYVNPENPNDRVRTMPGDPNSPNPSQQKPYVVDQNGGYRDVNGNPIPGPKPGQTPEAHIPYDDFKFKR